MEFTDTHVHFYFADFDTDREATIRRAQSEGIRYFINVGTDLSTSQVCCELAHAHPGFFASAGIHPHEAEKFTEADLSAWEKLLADERMVAVGEVGLDFFRNHAPRDIQERVFRQACRLARKTSKPLIVHVREAFPDVFRILNEELKGEGEGVFHCFSGDVTIMQQALSLGFYISLAAPVTYKKNELLRAVARAMPKDRLLLETDAPFLPPQSRRGKRNESAFMLETARLVAELRGIDLETLAAVTTENARRLFKFYV